MQDVRRTINYWWSITFIIIFKTVSFLPYAYNSCMHTLSSHFFFKLQTSEQGTFCIKFKCVCSLFFLFSGSLASSNYKNDSLRFWLCACCSCPDSSSAHTLYLAWIDGRADNFYANESGVVVVKFQEGEKKNTRDSEQYCVRACIALANTLNECNIFSGGGCRQGECMRGGCIVIILFHIFTMRIYIPCKHVFLYIHVFIERR